MFAMDFTGSFLVHKEVQITTASQHKDYGCCVLKVRVFVP